MNQQKYGLFTTIAMIVGIVIGSGIFFKSDNVLVYTNGNIFLGILVFIIAAFSIILEAYLYQFLLPAQMMQVE